MSQTTPSKKKSLHPYAGLVEGIKRQEQAKARKQPKERPKVLRDRRASKMSVLKQEVPGETAAVQQQQPISSAMGAGQALAEQWHVQGARTAPAAAKISAQGLKDSRASSTTTRKSGGVQFHQQTVLVVAVIAVTVLLLVTVTGVLVGIGVARGKNKTCRTEGCLRYSKALLESMDTSTNPCHDFSRYVCGRYSNPRNYSVQEEAQFQFRKEIAMAARNTSLTATGQNELQKTLRFLKSCLDVVETKDIDNTDTVRSGLGDAGIGWPSLQGADADTLLKATVFFSEYLGWPSLLDYVIEHGTTHASQVTILPSRLTKAIVYRGFSHRKEEGFRHFFTLLTHNYARAANGSVNDTNNGNVTLEEVMSAEQRCVTFPDYQQGASDMVLFSNTTERSILKAMGALKEALAKLPWQTLRLANLSFSTNYWPLVKKVLVGIVESPRDFELVMGWHVVHYAAPITSHELATAYHDTFASSVDALQKHKRFCLSNTVRFFGVASYSLYVRDHYTAAVREEVESMAKAVRRTYFATLTDSTYDWASLNDTLKYLRRSQSHRLREILDDVGDIHFDIVANYRTMTVAYTKAGEDMQWLLGYELDENNPYPFRAGGEAPMLPWAIEFPYYRHDVPAYLRRRRRSIASGPGAHVAAAAVLRVRLLHLLQATNGSHPLQRRASMERRLPQGVPVPAGQSHAGQRDLPRVELLGKPTGRAFYAARVKLFYAGICAGTVGHLSSATVLLIDSPRLTIYLVCQLAITQACAIASL
ncbi:endothelin-converting enzyme 2-like isoform X2 [Dermacentor albipictus]|uniref:endothelin-converting enzyme 2-like isoform X2 n=1 Tax=Dermacentor albipictus TaxID=60249 RepID=UPI0031FCEE14